MTTTLFRVLLDHANEEVTIRINGELAFYGLGKEIDNVMAMQFMRLLEVESVKECDDFILVEAYL